MHTEGPWCFEAENGRAHPRVYGADNCLIAEVGNANLMRWEVWDHDARLIAAAPDMKDAIVQIKAFALATDENNWRDMRLHIERQCAVLAKATEPRP